MDRINNTIWVFLLPSQAERMCQEHLQIQECLASVWCKTGFWPGVDALLTKVCSDRDFYMNQTQCLSHTLYKDDSFNDCNRQNSPLEIGKPEIYSGSPIANFQICDRAQKLMGCSFTNMVEKCGESAAQYGARLTSLFARAYQPDCAVVPGGNDPPPPFNISSTQVLFKIHQFKIHSI